MQISVKRRNALLKAESFFPGRSYSDALRDAILEKCSRLTDDEFCRVVERTCNSAKRLPTAADYLAEAAPLLKAYRDKERVEKRERIENAPNRCHWCAALGILNAYKRGTTYEFAFRCHKCGTARTLGLSQSMPEWNDDEHTEDFEIRPMYPERIARDALRIVAP